VSAATCRLIPQIRSLSCYLKRGHSEKGDLTNNSEKAALGPFHLLRFGLDFRRLFVIAPFPISGGGIYSVCPFVSFLRALMHSRRTQ
jgi:hypothetical protein